jgi:hypothetical protein
LFVLYPCANKICFSRIAVCINDRQDAFSLYFGFFGDARRHWQMTTTRSLIKEVCSSGVANHVFSKFAVSLLTKQPAEPFLAVAEQPFRCIGGFGGVPKNRLIVLICW